MPRPRLFLGLLAAVLLSLGNAGLRNAHAATVEPIGQAELVTASTDLIGAALPAPFVSVAPQAELDLRRVHPVPRLPRDASRFTGPGRQRSSSASASHTSRGEYAAARLLRGGIDSSSLGTPPPQS